MKLWPLLLVSAGVLYPACVGADRVQAHRDADSAASFASDLAAGRLSTPAAFEARCGVARSTQSTARGTELDYFAPDGVDYYVTFLPSGPSFEAEHLRRRGSGFEA